MATISASTSEKVYSVRQFAGLNESLDGDAKLKLGEASEMLNWMITKEGSLKRRPGNETLFGLCVAYTISYGEEEKIAELTSEDSLTVRSSAVAANGLCELGGSTGTLTAENAATFVDWYWKEADMRFWRLTRSVAGEDSTALYGTRVTVSAANPKPVRCLWKGMVAGKRVLLAACSDRLYSLYNEATDSFSCNVIGTISTTGHVHIFGFNGIAYILDGTEYRQYNGTALTNVEGYRPLVAITIQPNGAFETSEQINKLNGHRRGWLSPDGIESTFRLPEHPIASLDYVIDLSTGDTVPAANYTYSLNDGTITFSSAPQQSVNSYEVGWTVSTTFRNEVIKMKYSELYSGSQDNRVFLYGDGSAEALYSGLDYNGQPRGDYFPDLSEVMVGDENTPITAMIRHYGSLICYKSDSTYSLQFGITTLADESMTPAFYVTPVNRQIGNVPLGQVQLVDNAPITLYGREAYQWRNSGRYTSNLTADERQAKCVSDRVRYTLGRFKFENCVCYDDNYHQDYYICHQNEALVYHYGSDAWSHWDRLGSVCMVSFHGDVFFGTLDGRVERISENIDTADGDAIPCYWESGSVDFGQDYYRKYSAALWIGLKPTANTSVTVMVQTDRKETFAEKVLSADNVRNPGTREPYLKRLKFKAKKFIYYKFMLESEDRNARPTVVAADIRVRTTGYAK